MLKTLNYYQNSIKKDSYCFNFQKCFVSKSIPPHNYVEHHSFSTNQNILNISINHEYLTKQSFETLLIILQINNQMKEQYLLKLYMQTKTKQVTISIEKNTRWSCCNNLTHIDTILLKQVEFNSRPVGKITAITTSRKEYHAGPKIHSLRPRKSNRTHMKTSLIYQTSKQQCKTQQFIAALIPSEQSIQSYNWRQQKQKSKYNFENCTTRKSTLAEQSEIERTYDLKTQPHNLQLIQNNVNRANHQNKQFTDSFILTSRSLKNNKVNLLNIREVQSQMDSEENYRQQISQIIRMGQSVHSLDTVKL